MLLPILGSGLAALLMGTIQPLGFGWQELASQCCVCVCVCVFVCRVQSIQELLCLWTTQHPCLSVCVHVYKDDPALQKLSFHTNAMAESWPLKVI